MNMRRRKIWGWGYEDQSASPSAIAFAEASLGAFFGGAAARATPPEAERIALPAPRVRPPAALEPLFDASVHARLVHALGRSYADLARATRGEFPHAPDFVARPRTEQDVVRVLDFAASANAAVIPYGGGTSVCGGVEPAVGPGYAGSISLDLGLLSGVTELDESSLAANIQAGTLGPDLETALKARSLTLRHFPQSFEMSTLGGWIATRAAGHFATLYTHIDDLVQSVRVVTPSGTLETRRLPGSGAGPQPERLFIGSEGALGVITSAWVRVFRKPVHRSVATVRFASFERGLAALRGLAQSGLHPSNCRLIDAAEALVAGTPSGDQSLLFLAFESASFSQQALITQAIEIARAEGGVADEVKSSSDPSAARDASADSYKGAFFRAPYLRDEIILRGIFAETYETAAPWSALEALDAAVRAAVAKLELGPHLLARRITHVYRDGCAPYYTVLARARPGEELAMASDVKRAITDAVIDSGGTSTHHHAVGRDVMPWYERERPALFASALEAAKRSLDPRWILNPGVLLRAPDR